VLEALDHAAVSYQLVLTKADEATPKELATALGTATAALAAHPAAYPDVLATSATSGAGIPELRAAIAKLIARRR
jgi:GTP-binding protein